MASALSYIKKVRGLLNSIKIVSGFKNSRSIMTSEFKAAKAVEELESNPYFEKYAKKIATLQKTSPEEFLSRLKENFKVDNEQCKTEDKRESEKTYTAKPGTIPSNKACTKPKELSDVFKVDLIKEKEKSEIIRIWLDYHKNKDSVAASIPCDKYELIMSRGVSYPIFLLPLPRNNGYEFIVCQFDNNEVHFTPLIAYQTHKENSPECLSIVYYPDLKESKDLILMKGEFDKNILNAMEAQCLTNQLHLFYGEENKKRTNILERFTNEPDNFKHMDLIAELECLSF